jgi:hypothetical protein
LSEVKREEGIEKREEGRGKREEGRGKREEGRGKREEGRGKREEGIYGVVVVRRMEGGWKNKGGWRSGC